MHSTRTTLQHHRFHSQIILFKFFLHIAWTVLAVVVLVYLVLSVDEGRNVKAALYSIQNQLVAAARPATGAGAEQVVTATCSLLTQLVPTTASELLQPQQRELQNWEHTSLWAYLYADSNSSTLSAHSVQFQTTASTTSPLWFQANDAQLGLEEHGSILCLDSLPFQSSVASQEAGAGTGLLNSFKAMLFYMPLQRLPAHGSFHMQAIIQGTSFTPGWQPYLNWTLPSPNSHDDRGDDPRLSHAGLALWHESTGLLVGFAVTKHSLWALYHRLPTSARSGQTISESPCSQQWWKTAKRLTDSSDVAQHAVSIVYHSSTAQVDFNINGSTLFRLDKLGAVPDFAVKKEQHLYDIFSLHRGLHTHASTTASKKGEEKNGHKKRSSSSSSSNDNSHSTQCNDQYQQQLQSMPAVRISVLTGSILDAATRSLPGLLRLDSSVQYELPVEFVHERNTRQRRRLFGQGAAINVSQLSAFWCDAPQTHSYSTPPAPLHSSSTSSQTKQHSWSHKHRETWILDHTETRHLEQGSQAVHDTGSRSDYEYFAEEEYERRQHKAQAVSSLQSEVTNEWYGFDTQ